MTPIPEKLIYNLRNDAHTRKHFSINAWEGAGTCNTVGCIAGTAIFMEMVDLNLHLGGEERLKNRQIKLGRYSQDGQRILGIPYYETASHLFIPLHSASLIENLGPEVFSYLPTQARPDQSTFERILSWAKNPFSGEITPDRAALALERIVKDEIPYCDWSYAMEHA